MPALAVADVERQLAGIVRNKIGTVDLRLTGDRVQDICSARHVKHPELDSPRCARECVRTGAKYILIDGDTSYNLQGNFAQLAQFAGQRAKVNGSLQGSTIRVSSISEP